MSQGKPRKFTSEELKQFDGQNGQPLYIVFKGKVYDLTSSLLWPEGKHMGMHTRSDDLTEAIKRAPHSEENVYRFPLVGELEEAVLQAPAPPPVEKKVIEPQVQLPIQPSLAEMERRQFLKLAAAAGGAVMIIVLLSIFKAGILIPPTTAVSAVLITVKNPIPRPGLMVQLQLGTSTGDISALGMQPLNISWHGPFGTTNPKLMKRRDLQAGDVVTKAAVMGCDDYE